MFSLKLVQVQDLKILSDLKAQLERRANLLSELNFNTMCFRAHNEIKVFYTHFSPSLDLAKTAILVPIRKEKRLNF